MPPPAPPVIVTTDLDGQTTDAAPEQQQQPTSQHNRNISDPSHLSPLAAQPGHNALSPSSTVVPNSAATGGNIPPSPTLTYTSQGSSPSDGATLAPLYPNGEKTRHGRSNSIATAEDPFADARSGLEEKEAEKQRAHIEEMELAKKEGRLNMKEKWWLRKEKKRLAKLEKEGAGKKESHLDPDKDTTDVTPFTDNPSRLAMLVDPKSLDDLEKLGGIQGVLDKLGVDGTKGISTTAGDGGAPRSSDQMPGGNGPQWHATIEDRRRAYGNNDLPNRPSKSLWVLMWEAFKDKVLILLMIAAVISLALGLYQDLGQKHDLVYTDDCPQGCEPPKVEWIEGVAILVAVLIVVSVGSVNDWQKERQFKKLNDQREDRSVNVLRNGQKQIINVKELVVGDVAMLEPGEMIPVDGIFLRGHNVRCDESGATGESDAIKKSTYDECMAEKKNAQPGSRAKLDCFMISGAKVLEGVGEYLVTSVGTRSFNGRIMMAMRTDTEETPLQLKLNNLAELIAKCGGAAGILLFIALMIRYGVEYKDLEGDKSEKANKAIKNLIISVTIIVVAVPEGLPLAVTLALAFATKRMTKNNLLVRVLGSCETMGHATVVCTDKTGTLTQNVMSVVAGSLGVHGKFVRNIKDNSERSIADAPGHSAQDFAFDLLGSAASPDVPSMNTVASPELQTLFNDAIAINSTAFEDKAEGDALPEFVGSKTETALLRMARELGWANYQKVRDASEDAIQQMIPFSSELKAMGVVVKQSDGRFRLFVKGASEVLTLKCRKYVVTSKDCAPGIDTAPLDEEAQHNIDQTIDFYANQTLRTLALAYRDFEQWPPAGAEKFGPEEVPFNLLAADLTLIAIVGIEDPLRDGVPQAVAECQGAGVSVKMCTGDNVLTARSIARQCGIFTPGGIVMEGPVFRKLSDADRLEIVPRLQILARSSPEDKKLLVKTLKSQGEVVGVTGDGTNDGPALKLANVGFAMGIAGTEVAKEASDIILMDDSFSNIVLAIMWGRCVNDSVKKFLQFQISVNITAVVITFVSALASREMRSVLTAVQLLWVNLIMDTFAALALATDPATRESLKRKPDRKNAPLISPDMWKMITVQAAYQIIVCLVLHFAGKRILGMPNTIHNDAELRTLVFNCFVFCQIFNQLNCRRLDRKFNVFEGFFRNYWFIAIFLIMVGGQCLIVEVGGAAFSVQRPEARDWGISIIVGFVSLPIGVIVRLLPTKPFERLLIKIRLYPDPETLPLIVEDDEAAAAAELAEGDSKYYPKINTLKNDLTLYKRFRGGRLNGSSLVNRARRSKKLKGVENRPSDFLAMVPTLVGGTVGAGPNWYRTMTSKSEDPTAEVGKTNLTQYSDRVQLHPDTDPNDPLWARFGLTPPKK